MPSSVLSLRHVHLCPCSAVKFPDVAGSVIQLLMDFLGDTSTASALDVIFFVREIVETNEKLRPAILARLLDSFTQIRSSRVRAVRAATATACPPVLLACVEHERCPIRVSRVSG